MADLNTPESKRNVDDKRPSTDGGNTPMAQPAQGETAGTTSSQQEKVMSKDDATRRLQEALSQSGAAQKDVTLVKQTRQPDRVHQLPPQENQQQPAAQQKPPAQPIPQPTVKRQSQTADVPLPTPKLKVPGPEQEHTPAPKAVSGPQFAQKPAPSANSESKQQIDSAMPPVSKPAPTQPSGHVHPQNKEVVRRLRTYKDDAAQAMEQHHSSVMSVAAAAAQARSTPANTPQKTQSPYSIKKIAIAVIIAIFVAGGIAIATWAFFASDNQPKTSDRSVVPTPFFFTDNERGFTLDEKTPAGLKKTLYDAVLDITLALGAIEQIYVTETVVLDDQPSQSPEVEQRPVERIVETAKFLDAISARVEPAFTRSLSPSFMFGGHVFDGNQPFLIFRTDAFEQAFAGMLAWEETMSEDLAPIFGPPIARVRQSSSTPFTTKPFEDAVVRNQDARVLRKTNGDIALLYTFPTRSLVIITTNEHTLIEILTRMANTRRN